MELQGNWLGPERNEEPDGVRPKEGKFNGGI